MPSLTTIDFSLKDTLDCGQSFSWTKEGRGYVNADIGQVVYIEQRGNEILYETSHREQVDVQSLLGLHDPVDIIKKELERDGIMKESIKYAPGLRIVRDPFFPCLISFICSIWKNIPAIQLSMKRIRERWGPKYKFRSNTYSGMPSPEILAKATLAELRDLGLGFRAKYIKKTAEAIAEEEIHLETLQRMPYENARGHLKTLHGVGDKVADCVCLFSLGFLESFPIDVWIERVIQEHYDVFTASGKSYAKKSAAAREYFGRYAGYAQEYLFHYTRSLGRTNCPT